MLGDQRVIEYLNTALKHELAAVNQYWLHYRILDNWGYKDFAKTWRAESIEEMHHADKIVARILFLDGQPNMQSLDQLRIGKSVKEIIDCDLAAEMSARALYLDAAKYCDGVNDRVTRMLFEELTSDEEKHIDFLEAQLTLIGQLGEPLYAQKHVGKLEELERVMKSRSRGTPSSGPSRPPSPRVGEGRPLSPREREAAKRQDEGLRRASRHALAGPDIGAPLAFPPRVC